ncbi:MAG: hypothetical protein OEZ06_26255 [Myxococcales bacterium]|nr:hypothetical protein [Myxococcales bacterium]
MLSPGRVQRQQPSAGPWVHGLVVVFGLVALVCSVHAISNFSGDALIHFSLVEHAAEGAWFQFNRGEPFSASSSPLWTVLGAGLWRVGGLPAMAYGVKLLVVVSWLGAGALVVSLALRLGAPRSVALAMGVVAVGLPGSAWNWLQGSENGPFAALQLLSWLSLHRLSHRAATPARVIWPFVLAGLAAALRPEGLATCAAMSWLLLRVGVVQSRGLRPLAMLAMLVAAAPAYLLQLAATGDLIPASGMSRVMMARRDALSMSVAGLWFYGAALSRILAYAPLSALAIVALRSASSPVHERFQMEKPRIDAGSFVAAFALSVGLQLGVFTFATGAAHAGRYLIPLFCQLCVLAALGFAPLVRRRGGHALWPLCVLWLSLVAVVELSARFETQRFKHPLAEVLSATRLRQAHSDATLRAICALDCCSSDAVPSVALGEVQERLFFDARLNVRALDGVSGGASGRPPTFSPNGCPGVEGLFADPSLTAWLAAPAGEAFRGCTLGPRAQAILYAFRRRADAPGFRYVHAPRRMLVKDCRTSRPSEDSTH